MTAEALGKIACDAFSKAQKPPHRPIIWRSLARPNQLCWIAAALAVAEAAETGETPEPFCAVCANP